MQLVAYGAQDIYLTGNPQITFFKVVYRRHTNFSMEAIAQTWNGDETGQNTRCTSTISRNGDLVYRMYLEIEGKMPDQTPDNNPGVSWINSIELEIGGQKIDKHTGEWMEVWSELTQKNFGSTSLAAAPEGDGGSLFQRMSGSSGVTGAPSVQVLYTVPLQFWFCRNPGLALPLIALQYHEVKIILEHDFGGTFSGSSGFKRNTLYADYIYLDTDERRRFAQVSHEYLIEQVQDDELKTETSSDLNFNHPVKELIWTRKNGTGVSLEPVVGLGTADANGFAGAKYHLKLNGHDRFTERPHPYFSRTQIWEHHSGQGGLNSTEDGVLNDSICVYSFALKPEEHQPSGTCNFSRIDNAQLVSSASFLANSKIFAVNYNVLRIMSGMGGLAYSN